MDKLFDKLKKPFNGLWNTVEADMAVFENILLRLPVKSLLVLKSISKHWLHTTSSKSFISTYLYSSMKTPKYFSFYDADDFEDGIVSEMRQMERNGVFSESYVIPDFENLDNPLLIASFNGLICCMDDVSTCSWLYEVDLHICNPATQEVLLLPRGQSSVCWPVFGVAYSTEYHFYKIYKFFAQKIDMEEGCTQCEVYCSETKEWKQLGRVSLFPMNFGRSLVANHVCVKEKVYWFIADGNVIDIPTKILVVDSEENFREIELPYEGDISFLIELHGRICFVDWNDTNVYIWSYYEESKGWDLVSETEFPVNWYEVDHFYSVVAIGDEILFVYRDLDGLRNEVMYDVDLEMWKDFHIDEDSKEETIVVFPYFETLVPCSSTGLEG